MTNAERCGGAPILTVEEVSRRLRVSEATVYNLIRAGHLPAFRVGRSWRIDERDFEEYIRRQKTRLPQTDQQNRSA
jgi:excisionase family DNA binding protein